jgi:hypothetical protein|tara:strand:+ start:93 stop:302 length:210 start_codon:yes stop_codon:yes gene_type:complete
MAKWGTIEAEAKKFKQKKIAVSNSKPLTARVYLAGQALSGLMSRSSGSVNREYLKREAYEWADFMLEND